MTNTYRAVYQSVVRCDGCHKVSVQESEPASSIKEVIEMGKTHEWAFGRGTFHYCDDCYCWTHDSPLQSCSPCEKRSDKC